MRDYLEFPALSQIYLEDSYVLAIAQTSDSVTFSLEVVLTPNHPSYHDPRPNEQYCYARGRLVIPLATEINWVNRTDVLYTDPDGQVDQGNVDSMKYEDGWYDISGDWGRVKIRSNAEPQFDLD
jgi:hypothetical protein